MKRVLFGEIINVGILHRVNWCLCMAKNRTVHYRVMSILGFTLGVSSALALLFSVFGSYFWCHFLVEGGKKIVCE